MRNNLRKSLLLILSITMLTLLLVGCGNNDSSEQDDTSTAAVETSDDTTQDTEGTADGEEITLTFWTPTWHKDADEQVIASFEEMYPNIKVEPTYYSSDDIKTNLKIAASSDTLPDMWYMWGGYNYAEYYAEAGKAYNLTDYAAENNWKDTFISSALDLCKYEDDIIALPQVYTGLVMFYRTDIFEEYDISVPTTLEELEAAADTLIENDIVPFSTAATHVFRYTEALLEYYAGEEEHDALNSLEADWSESEAVTKTFTKLKEWADKGYFQSGFITEDAANANMYVHSGTAAMIMENSGMASDVVANEYDTDNYSYFSFPEARTSSYVKVTQFNKNLSDEKFEAAMTFWKYFYSSESLAQHSSIEQPTAIVGAELPENLSVAEGLLETIDSTGSYTTTDMNVPNEVMSAIHATEDEVLLEQIEPSELGAKVQEVIDSYKSSN